MFGGFALRKFFCRSRTEEATVCKQVCVVYYIYNASLFTADRCQEETGSSSPSPTNMPVAPAHHPMFVGLERAIELHAAGKYEEAIASLGDDVERKAPALAKRCRWAVDMAELLEDTAEKEKLFRKALGDAAKGAELEPGNFEIYKALAIGKGRLQGCVGISEKVQLAKEVKEDIDRALELNPEDSACWTVLGCWHTGVASQSWIVRQAMQALYFGNFPGASHEDAEECFLKAHSFYPNATNAVHLAKAYKALNNKSKYKEWLEAAIGMESDLPGYRISQDEARTLLAAA